MQQLIMRLITETYAAAKIIDLVNLKKIQTFKITFFIDDL